MTVDRDVREYAHLLVAGDTRLEVLWIFVAACKANEGLSEFDLIR